MKKSLNSAIVALVIGVSVFGSIGPSTAQTLAPLITPYVNESDMASIQQIFNSNPDANAPDLSLRYVHDGLDIVPTGNLKPFRAACSGRVHWVLAFDDGVNVMIECDSTYTLEYNFEPQSAGTGQTQLAHIAVVEGQAVLQGDVIGSLYVANAALAHVHFAVLKNWVNSCPEQYFDSAASNSILNLVHVRFPGTGMCHGGDVTPPLLITPYVNESDMASINEAFSSADSASPWGFVHDGIDFFPKGNLKSFRATCSGVVDSVQLQQNSVTSNWQVNLLIVCNPYVPDPNMGGYFSPLAVETIFEPRSTVQTDGQAQLDNITVTMGQAVTQGDVIGSLYTAGEGAHVHFGTIPLGSMLAHGVPNMPSCPEPHFAPAAKTSILNLLHAVWPGAGMCYYSSPNYSDSWWNATESGWGITITDHDTNAFVQWYTYDQTGHNQKYVISGGTFSSDKCQFNGAIQHVTGPSWTLPTFDPNQVTRTTVGSGTFDFCPVGLPTGTAVFNYTADGVTGSKQLTRLPFGNDVPHLGGMANTGAIDFTDLWWNPTESGWGVSVTQHGNNIFFRVFTYDTDGRPLLFVVSGVTFNSATSFTGQVTLTSGPWFGSNPFDPNQVVRTPAGTATLTFSDANNGVLSYTVNGVTVTKSITRMVF